MFGDGKGGASAVFSQTPGHAGEDAQCPDGAPLAVPNPTPKALGPCLRVSEGLAEPSLLLRLGMS